MPATLLLLVAAALPGDAGPAGRALGEPCVTIPCPSEWPAVWAEHGGEVTALAGLRFTHTRATGDTLWLFVAVKEKTVVQYQWAPYRLRPEAVPAEIDFRDRKGIYLREGDRLTVCLSAPHQPRPKEFRTTNGDGRLLLVLERERPQTKQDEKFPPRRIPPDRPGRPY